MKIELRQIDDIRPYAENPRVIDQAVDAVANSIRQFGWRQPIVVDADGEIVVGHVRYEAAKKLGLTKVPVHVAKDLTPEQARGYRIADNQTNTLSTWDDELLFAELTALQELAFDLGAIGFSPEELASILAPGIGEGNCDPDWTPEPPDKPTTQPGDLWIMGNHRLLCGDSSIPADVDRLLDGEKVDLIYTDPPYGVGVEPRSARAAAAGLSSFSSDKKKSAARAQDQSKLRPRDRRLANDFLSEQEFRKLLQAWFENMARVLPPGRSFFLWGGYSNLADFPPLLKTCGLRFAQAIVWNKQHPVLSRKDFLSCFELAFYGWKTGASHRFFGPSNALDLWHVKKVNPQSMIHLTQKPVELGVRAIEYCSQREELVLDLFAGSGSTLIAAEQTGRRAYLMEIDALYCDLIVTRWQEFTGRQAQRTGASKPTRAKTA